MQRARRIGASVLVVVSVLLLLLTGYGWWAKRYFLDSERFTAKANQILDQPEVSEALASAITDEISDASGRDLAIARPFIGTIVGQVVQSDQFQDVFDAAVLRLHKAIVGGDAREAVLDLTDIVDRVRNAIEPIAPNLADEIPEGEELQVRILDKSQLDTIYDITNLVEDIVVALTVLTVVFMAGAIALSPRRWRTLALLGWVTLGVFVVSLIMVRIGRGVIGSLPERAEYSDAAESVYKVITRGLMVQGVVFAVLGLLVALGAGWTDRNGGWAGVRGVFRRSTAWLRAQVPERAPAAVPTGAGAAAGGVASVAVATGSPPDAHPGDAAGSPDVSKVADDEAARASAEAPIGASTGAAVVTGVLAARLPEPRGRVRVAHWWRAAALLVLGLFAVFSPTSLTTVVVVLLGFAALYLALTEAVAAWGTPKDPPPQPDDEAPSTTS